mmetsp:Transcript_37189/g.148446  ORF Transcript_37189/g.148446 Transcript_37189/m.148446 type:complete len:145 (-) Transcript_37189:732-1166(-)
MLRIMSFKPVEACNITLIHFWYDILSSVGISIQYRSGKSRVDSSQKKLTVQAIRGSQDKSIPSAPCKVHPTDTPNTRSKKMLLIPVTLLNVAPTVMKRHIAHLQGAVRLDLVAAGQVLLSQKLSSLPVAPGKVPVGAGSKAERS